MPEATVGPTNTRCCSLVQARLLGLAGGGPVLKRATGDARAAARRGG